MMKKKVLKKITLKKQKVAILNKSANLIKGGGSFPCPETSSDTRISIKDCDTNSCDALCEPTENNC